MNIKKKLPENKTLFYLILLWTIFCELYLLFTNLLKNRNYYRWLSSQNKIRHKYQKNVSIIEDIKPDIFL